MLKRKKLLNLKKNIARKEPNYEKDIYILLLVTVVLCVGCASKFETVNQSPSVVVWSTDFRWNQGPSPKIVVTVWNNGDIMWSTNAVYGGMPYFYGKTTADVGEMLFSFQQKGYLSTEYSLDYGRIIDMSFTSMFISVGTNTLFTRSHHEIIERNTNLVALSQVSSTLLNGRNRDDVLKEDKPEYVQYRAMWKDIREQISNMLPFDGRIVNDVKVSQPKFAYPPSIIWKKEKEGRGDTEK